MYLSMYLFINNGSIFLLLLLFFLLLLIFVLEVDLQLGGLYAFPEDYIPISDPVTHFF